MSNIVIGIEGLVGAGKTSICRELIKKIPNTVYFMVVIYIEQLFMHLWKMVKL